jgi:L-amino acid N-acyltransferase YncA
MSQEAVQPSFIRLATVKDAAAIARVHVDSWRTTYQGLISAEYLANMSYDERATRWASILSRGDQRECVYVALDKHGQIVGFASGGPLRGKRSTVYKGELYAIYLLTAVQRSGLGSQLVTAVARHLLNQGMSSMLVWVLANNPARHFYEALGGKYVRMKMEAVGGDMQKELAYGWKDLAYMLDRPD